MQPAGFCAELAARTRAGRDDLLAAPIVRDALAGIAARSDYVAFLTQAYHHVWHTVPLLMAMGARLPDRLAWLRDDVAEYIAEERGHDAWILEDIRACGADPARIAPPDFPVEVMVAYAYDLIHRGNPAAFLGMVYVLEGTSVQIALRAADAIQAATRLPDAAFTYLRSHGTLDRGHTEHLAQIVERLPRQDQDDVAHCAPVFYRLYANVFRALPRAAGGMA